MTNQNRQVPDAAIQVEARRHLELSDDELLMMMLPPGQQTAFSREGALMRGREIFHSVLDNVRDRVCEIYRQRADKHENTVALVALIASALIGNATLGGIPAFAFAALVAKIGLDNVCGGDRAGQG